jgi:hypothetical protein
VAYRTTGVGLNLENGLDRAIVGKVIDRHEAIGYAF